MKLKKSIKHDIASIKEYLEDIEMFRKDKDWDKVAYYTCSLQIVLDAMKDALDEHGDHYGCYRNVDSLKRKTEDET